MDAKRFICRETNAAFSAKMQSEFNNGHIAPFSVVFPETVCRAITNDDKMSKEIIQFSFLVSDCDGKLLLTYRTPLSDEKQAGHTISVKDSVLIGWSPVIQIPGNHPYPMSDDDILWAYHQEVQDSHLQRPQVHFLGLVLNEVKGIRYYLYVFHVRYAEKEPDLKGLLKDRHDSLCAYHLADDSLIERVRDKKADLRALELYTERDLSKFDLGSSRVVPFDPATKPPFRLHAPDAFVSHATNDHGAEDSIVKALSVAGISCWSDHRSLKAGDIWFREIEAGIKYGACFILLCSHNALESEAVAKEVALAVERQGSRDHNYPIIPLPLEGARKRDFIPTTLGHCQAYDLRNMAKDNTVLPGLVEYLKQLLPSHTGRQS